MGRSVEVQIGGSTHTIEEPRLRRAKLIGKQVQLIFKEVPNLEMEIETWSRTWEKETAYKLDRVSARRLLGPQLQYEPELGPDGEPLTDAEGDPVLKPKTDESGEYVYGPDHLKHLTNEDWEGSGQTYTRAQPPSDNALLIHMFEVVYDKAEEPLMELLALMLIGNAELRQARRAGDAELRRLIEEKRDLLDDEGDIGDALALAVETYKLLRAQLEREKERVGEARALLRGGLKQETQETTEETAEEPGTAGSPESSISSSAEPEADTDGATKRSSSESSPTALATSSS
jgi:hypothetical protein